MSSPRKAIRCEGLLVGEGRRDSPVRLPEHRADDFVHHFNRVYQSVGMTLTQQPENEPDKPEQSRGVRLLKRRMKKETPNKPDGP